MDNPLNPTVTELVPGDPLALPGGPSVATPVASYIHTLVVVLLMLGVSVMSAKTMEARKLVPDSSGPLQQYVTTFVWLWLLALICYIGMRARKITIREVIGGRWKSVDDFLVDIAIAAGFWLAATLVLVGLKILLDPSLLKITPGSLPPQAKALAPLAPRNVQEIMVWILLSVTAGLCEEFVFRGYLQRQFTALTRNAAAGIALSALVFGVGHLYQGTQQMCIIALYGAMFGALAYFRKSVRPGMIAHAAQDTLSGIALSIAVRLATK